VHYRPAHGDALARDVRTGLGGLPKCLHPKYLYDAEGSRLFDQICDTREYYPTRSEQALLNATARTLVENIRPDAIVELGSGAARKTRSLLDAAGDMVPDCRYVPVDVSEDMLRASALQLLHEYRWLTIHGIVADYTRQLHLLPTAKRRMILFIGSTIGNFEPSDAQVFLSAIAQQMRPDDRLILGTDLVKDHDVLNAAYNDSRGLNAAFNKNILTMLNRELGADFELQHFEHRARFVPDSSQMELHLLSTRQQQVTFSHLDWSVDFKQGETILTEISRKFTRQSVTDTLAAAGLELLDWHTPDDDYFGLSVSRRNPSTTTPAASARKSIRPL
jgi:L-histidine N-alpha-methyltransferase